MSSTGAFNLYRWLDVPEDAPSAELCTLILELDEALDRSKYPDNGGMRKKLQIAHGVLNNEERRAIYDRHAQRPHNWNQVEYLANFDRWPEQWEVPHEECLFRIQEPEEKPTEEPGWGSGPWTTFKEPCTEPDPFPINPYASGYQAAVPAPLLGPGPQPYVDDPMERVERLDTAPLKTRVVMFFIDAIIIALFTAMVVSDDMQPLAAAIFTLLYFVGCEVYLGATFAKKLFGYQVRNAETGANLSIAESLKRNFWRLIVGIPVFGTFISGPLLLVLGSSLAFSSDGRGFHDRLADAEVVRKY